MSVSGVVTAEGGRLGTPPLVAIADTTGGIVVRMPDGIRMPGRGTTIRATGQLADPYGQLEVRPNASGLLVTGTGVVPSPSPIAAADLGERTEARLVQIVGIAKAAPSKGTSGDLVIDLLDVAGTSFRVSVDASSGVAAADIPLNRSLRLTGIVGQHASRKGELDGYRLWLRDRADIVLVAGAGPGASPAASTSPVSVAQAVAAPDGSSLAIEGVVTAGPALLDTSGRRVVIEDESGAIEVLLPTGSPAPGVGARIRAIGEKTHAWDAPRLRATTVTVVRTGVAVTSAARSQALSARDEWRLVRLAGTILSVERIGDRWRAELRLVNGDRVPILGQAGAAIPSTHIAVGRPATIVGIVKRPYPTATDRRFALVPRSQTDIAIGPPGSTPADGSGGDGAGDSAAGGPVAGGTTAGDATPDTDLATLFEHIGAEVRVGGLVSALTADGFLLDDGTAVARIVLEGDATILLAHIRGGDAVAARGTVCQDGEELRIVVPNASGLVRVGELGEALPIVPAASGDEPGVPGRVSAPGPTAMSGTNGLLPAELSLATIGALTLASALVTVLRRRALLRRSRVRVLARLATLSSQHRRPADREPG